MFLHCETPPAISSTPPTANRQLPGPWAARWPAMDDHIDALLEQYLHLLDEYTALRTELNGLQKAMYQDIARAHYTAERGMRFGADHYDGRMRASRRIAFATGAQDVPEWRVVSDADAAPTPDPHGPPAEETMKNTASRGVTATGEDEEGPTAAIENKKLRPARDPLRWFGLMVPPALRQAQTRSVLAVERVIPRLASVDGRMKEVEIEVRRARKRRTKATMAAVKGGRPEGETSPVVMDDALHVGS